MAVVAQAVWGMAKNLTPDAPRFTLAIAAAIITLVVPTSAGQVAAIAFGVIVGCAFMRAREDEPHVPMDISLGKGAGVACLAVFFALLIGVLPFWDDLRRFRAVRSALTGVNAAVVGLLLAALYTPVWTSAILRPADFALGLAAFGLLVFWKVPPWLVVILSAAAGWGLERIAL